MKKFFTLVIVSLLSAMSSLALVLSSVRMKNAVLELTTHCKVHA